MSRLAKSLVTLRDQVNTKWPGRSKASDGWIGDAAHAARASDHNPNKEGVVCALDITHDPIHGLDASKLAEEIRLSGDPRVNYVISNGRIANSGKAWRTYTGANAHTKHCHISVHQKAALYDDAKPWKIDGAVTAPQTGVPVVVPQVRPLLKKGSKGDYVRLLQEWLNAHGYGLKVDGDFGKLTDAAVRAFQKAKGLVVDGLVGSKTWAALEPRLAPVPVTDWPAYVKKFFKDTVGLSDVAASAFTAGFIWESGGNQEKPWTIVWDAIGDGGKSHGAGQWNGVRNTALRDFAFQRGKPYTDPDIQLAFAAHELKTTEKRADAALRASRTIEEANSAAITYWRPSAPHAAKRLEIARALLS